MSSLSRLDRELTISWMTFCDFSALACLKSTCKELSTFISPGTLATILSEQDPAWEKTVEDVQRLLERGKLYAVNTALRTNWWNGMHRQFRPTALKAGYILDTDERFFEANRGKLICLSSLCKVPGPSFAQSAEVKDISQPRFIPGCMIDGKRRIYLEMPRACVVIMNFPSTAKYEKDKARTTYFLPPFMENTLQNIERCFYLKPFEPGPGSVLGFLTNIINDQSELTE